MIRFAKESDAAALLEIYRPYIEETSITFETEVPSEAEFAGRIRETLEKFPYLVYEEDGEILGYAYAHTFYARAAYDWTVESSVYVRRELRRGGVGSALYQRLFEILKAQGIRNVCAVITVPNAPSMGFHAKFGFQVGGVLPDFGYKLGEWHGVSYLYLPLGDGDAAPKPVIPLPALAESWKKPINLS